VTLPQWIWDALDERTAERPTDSNRSALILGWLMERDEIKAYLVRHSDGVLASDTTGQ
jgi:hypothetical protein